MMNAEIGQGFEPGVGALLRASRLRCGEELRDVADILRIRYPYLEAIEDGNYQNLPGVAYAIGFVRAYADHLGLDTEEVVRRFKAETENLERRSELVFPSPIPERGTPGAAIIFVGLLVAAVAYGAWYVGTSEESVFDDLVSPIPDRLAALVGSGDTPPVEPEAASPAGSEMRPDVAPATPPMDASPAEQPAEPMQTGTESPVTPAETPAVAETAPMEDGAATADAASVPLPETATPEPAAMQAPATEDPAEAVARAAADAIAAVDTATTESPVAEETAAEVLPPSAPEFTAPAAVAPPEAPAPTASVPDQPAEAEPQVAEVTPQETPAAETASDLTAAVPETGAAEMVAPDETAAGSPTPDVTDNVTQAVPAESPITEPAQPVVADTPEAAVSDAPDTPPAGDAQVAALPQTPEPAATETATETAEPAQAAAVAEPEPEVVAPVVAGGSRVVVRAKSDSWIQVRDGVARRLLVTRLLRAGDSYRVPDQPGLTLLTGNAGALEILVDGEPVNSIGEVGAVRRNVALDAERLKDGTAVLD